MSCEESSGPLLLNVLKALPVPLLFNLVWLGLSLRDAKTPRWNLITSLDCIVPRHLLPCSLVSCWVLRKTQVCSCDGSDRHPFQDSAGCCGVSVSRAGDTAGGQAFVLCLYSQHPLQSSLSLKRNVVEKHLPQCSSSVLFHVLRTRCCSRKHFKHLCSPSKFSSCYWLSTPSFECFGLFSNEIPEPGELLLAQPAHGIASVHAQRSPWCLHHCSLWGMVPSIYCVSLGG